MTTINELLKTSEEVKKLLAELSQCDPCPTIVEHDRDGAYDRCTICGESWPSGGNWRRTATKCESALMHLTKIANKE